ERKRPEPQSIGLLIEAQVAYAHSTVPAALKTLFNEKRFGAVTQAFKPDLERFEHAWLGGAPLHKAHRTPEHIDLQTDCVRRECALGAFFVAERNQLGDAETRFGVMTGINLFRCDEDAVFLPEDHDVNQAEYRFQLAEFLQRPVEKRFG